MPDDYPDTEQGSHGASAGSPAGGEGGDPRARLLFAGVLGVALVAVVIAVLIVGSSGGSDAPDVEPAPTECVDGWNESLRALLLGKHNFTAHQYTDVQVLYVDPEAQPSDAENGVCAVIFGRATLDPEPGASGQVKVANGAWLPMNIRLDVDERELQKLQVEALRGSNAELQEDGTIVADDV